MRIFTTLGQTKWHLAMLVISTSIFAALVWYIQRVDTVRFNSKNKPLPDALKSDVSVVLAVLRALQGLLSAATLVGLHTSLQLLQWHFVVSRPAGLRYVDHLALSPSTTFLGTAGIALWGPGRCARFFALSRILLITLVGLSGSILFFRTQFITLYDRAFSYNVVAGVGVFDGSYIQPFLDRLKSLQPDYPHQIVPYSHYEIIQNLVSNPLYSIFSPSAQCPIAPLTGSCASYLLSGGIMMAEPFLPRTIEYPSHSVVKLDRVPSVQLDFTPLPQGYAFLDSDCDVFGEAGILFAIKMCVSFDPRSGGLNAGLFVCTNGTTTAPDYTLTCQTTSLTPNITTTLRYSPRLATILTSRSNFSILSTANIKPPPSFNPSLVLNPTTIPPYRQALAWALNFTAAAIPAPSSIVQNFWALGTSGRLDEPALRGSMNQMFHSLVAFPIWLCNGNGFGNPNSGKAEMVGKGFDGVASVVKPYTIVVLDFAMVVVFWACEGLVLLVIWGLLLWVVVMRGKKELPVMSSYGAFDMMEKMRVEGKWDDDGVESWEADDGEVRENTRWWRVLVAKGEEDRRRMEFTQRWR
ncbi:hypothetical protein B0T16DRAFT_463169 [Cercophora newfieldiana]|uniref:Uncharacterized protein n=1 Tax=Cercophora newfieldiana TaxID=92897 RepID=A0AA40CIA8_9PEZI|nr:hypothetical protein B0T16DRAFT_463169 [Cercophora newfieldiana]